MAEINRRRFMVGLGIVAAAGATGGFKVAGPLIVNHTDHGVATAVDTHGNSFAAYISEYQWNGKSALSYVDKALVDLSGNVEMFRLQEDMALLECIAESEGRTSKDVYVVTADGELMPFDSLRAA